MKQMTKGLMCKSLFTFLMIAFFQTILWAQDNGGSASGSSTTTTKSVSVTSQSDWYTSPWVWVVGAAVFILLLIALMRGGGSGSAATTSRTDKVTVTKSSTADDI